MKEILGKCMECGDDVVWNLQDNCLEACSCECLDMGIECCGGEYSCEKSQDDNR